MSKIIYLDIDDTYVDTEEYIRKVLKSNGLILPSTDSVYKLRDQEGYYKNIIEMVMSDYSSIPKKKGAMECIKLLETEYEIILCSSCFSDAEEEAKKKFAEKEGRKLILCKEHFVSADKVDMSGAIFVNDRLDVLNMSNAEHKYYMFNPYNTGSDLDRMKFKGDLAFDWYMLFDYLMEGDEDAELRKYFCERIPQFSKTSRV